MALALVGSVTVNKSAFVNGGRTSVSQSHDCGSAALRALLAGFKVRDNGGDRTISAVSYGGQNLTKINGASVHNAYSGSNYQIIEWWYLLLASLTGTNTFLATYSASAGSAGDAVSLIALSDVDQSSPIGATNTANNTPVNALQVALTTQQDNSWVIGGLMKNLQSTTLWTPDSNNNELTDTNTGTGSAAGDQAITDLYRVVATAGATSIGATADGSTAPIAGGAFEIKQALAGQPTLRRYGHIYPVGSPSQHRAKGIRYG